MKDGEIKPPTNLGKSADFVKSLFKHVGRGFFCFCFEPYFLVYIPDVCQNFACKSVTPNKTQRSIAERPRTFGNCPQRRRNKNMHPVGMVQTL